MFSRVSTETIYLRFHSPYPHVPEQMLAFMSDTQGRYKQAFVAVAEGEIVGHAMYVVLGDGRRAEMAIIVEDGWQSNGVGKSLLCELARRARLGGVETLTAEVLLENRRMLDLVAATFAGSYCTMRDGLWYVRMPLEMSEPGTYTSRALRRAA